MYRDFYKQFKNLQNGIIGGVTKKFGKIEIPVPPLPEQQRIVAKIEELFAELDNCVAMLKKVKEQLEVYRQVVLQAVFGNKKYETVRICQFADVGTGATPLKSNANYYGGEIPWVNSSKVNEEYIYSIRFYYRISN